MGDVMRFKVGDRVRVLEDDASGAYVRKGEIGIILKVEKDYSVKMDSENIWYFVDKDLELVGNKKYGGYHSVEGFIALEKLIETANKGLEAIQMLSQLTKDDKNVYNNLWYRHPEGKEEKFCIAYLHPESKAAKVFLKEEPKLQVFDRQLTKKQARTLKRELEEFLELEE